MGHGLRWGVLGAARVAERRMLPGLRALGADVVAVASRDLGRAQALAGRFGVPRAHGSYEDLLADPAVDAVYVPLPNHLHVAWTARALEAGKHVLCEKPLGLSAVDAAPLLAARERSGRHLEEAFVVRTHPRWQAVRDVLRSGRIGPLRSMAAHFGFFNDDPANVRNVAGYGGGALLDLGCYAVTLFRWLSGREPERVSAVMDRDPRFGTDRATSARLDFGDAQATFTCGTQSARHQAFEIVGERGAIRVPVPFGPPADQPTEVFVDDGRDVAGGAADVLRFPPCDQYAVLARRFAEAARGEAPPATPLEDALANMRVLDAIARAADTGASERP